jgi:hypothetical protein
VSKNTRPNVTLYFAILQHVQSRSHQQWDLNGLSWREADSIAAVAACDARLTTCAPKVVAQQQ